MSGPVTAHLRLSVLSVGLCKMLEYVNRLHLSLQHCNVEVWRVSTPHEPTQGYGYYGWGELNILIPTLAAISKLAPAINPAGMNFPEL